MKKFILGVLSLISIFSLSSCSVIKTINNLISEYSKTATGDYQLKDQDYIEASNNMLEPYSGCSISLKEVQESEDYENLDTIGNQKILVIPCYFTDYGLSSLKETPSVVKENIYKTFFGTTEENGYWESVASFYEKSSYGKLHITGGVSDWYNTGISLSELSKNTNKYKDPTYYVLRNAIDWYKTNYSDIDEYDTDKDGFIDAVWLVYAPPYYSQGTGSRNYATTPTEEEQELLWAYTYWDYAATPDTESPVANCYAWASSYFMYQGTNAGTDAHTFIHETGHMMGFDDYYDYKSSENGYSPCGGLDMMDDNIGDHDAYTKYLAGWVTPQLITSTGSYEISLFQETGECYLVPANKSRFSYSAFDEYLLIEFYSPTGLNELDSQINYANIYPKMFTSYGVKIYHIDSRLVLKNLKEKTLVLTNYFSSAKVTNETTYEIAASNTESYSLLNSSYKLINLLSASGNNNYYCNSYAQNSDLFTNKKQITSFTFNDGSTLEYKIKIQYQSGLFTNPSSATITIS